jgi:hypothetical protein
MLFVEVSRGPARLLCLGGLGLKKNEFSPWEHAGEFRHVAD